jgi:hypothetical protein
MPDEKTLANMALQFMNRVQLSPPEIDAFMAVTTWLRARAGIPVAPPASELQQPNNG